MNLITVEQAREHCKADSEDDGLLALYGNAAEKAVARLANRNFYATSTELNTARAAIPATLDAALLAYDAAVTDANALEDVRAVEVGLQLAEQELADKMAQLDNTIYGRVADDDVVAAVLLTLGHLWANREDVVAGQGAAAVKLPQGAAYLVWPHTRLGRL